MKPTWAHSEFQAILGYGMTPSLKRWGGGEGRGERGESPLISHTESCFSFLTNEKSTYLLSCYEVAMRINYNSVYVKFRTEFLKNSIQVEF